MTSPRKSVFVSYAHEDRKWADELKTSLAPWIRDKRVELWLDSRIQAGAQWRREIDRAIGEATVAVLLVTRHFFDSDFIMTHELPALLKHARKQQVRLLWIAVEHSAVDATDLSQYQAVNDPERPLQTLRPAQRNKALEVIAKKIANAVTLGTIAESLEIVDRTTEPLQAAVENRKEQRNRKFGVQAVYEPERDRISFEGASDTITFADFALLPDEDQEFLADLDDSLRLNYQRWREVRKTLGEGKSDGKIEGELKRITRRICKDLNDILEFLKKMHKAELEDHYGRYRFLCSQLKA